MTTEWERAGDYIAARFVTKKWDQFLLAVVNR